MKSVFSTFGVAAFALGFGGFAGAVQPLEVNPLPKPRNLHGSIVVGDYYFIISGDEPMPDGFTNQVITAKINPDRSLGAWFQNRPLPINVIYIGNNVLRVKDKLYIVAGQEVSDIPGAANPGSEYNHSPNNTAIYATVDQTTGVLGDWQRSAPYAATTGQGAAAATDGRALYVIGGLEDPGEKPSNQVFFTTLDSNGIPTSWKATSPLPTPLANHCAFVNNGSIYTLGGIINEQESSATQDVYVSEIQPDGSLSPWRVAPQKLSYNVNLASAAAADDFLFLFCGRTPQRTTLSKVQFAQITSSGLSNWADRDTPITARSFSSAAMDPIRRSVYVSGGRFSSNYADINDKVFCFPLRPSNASLFASRSFGGFKGFEEAKEFAQSMKKNIFTCVYSSDIQFSSEAMIKLSQDQLILAKTENFLLAQLDIAESPSLQERYGIYRVPSYMLLDPNGQVLKRKDGLRSVQELLTMFAN
ncbi:MAG: kelch repeat-containing protein [Candidatus Sumerlaeia bacterium]|nr:kelch repeat-containing protein [Candidatus Sumerlaeia bacterium]